MSLLLEAYDQERAAYLAYVKAARGEDLVGNQRISISKVEQAREFWLTKLHDMHDLGTAKDLMHALQERANESTKEVKRG